MRLRKPLLAKHYPSITLKFSMQGSMLTRWIISKEICTGRGSHMGHSTLGKSYDASSWENDSICVHEVGANACLHFLLIRYFWYTQVILNKHVNAYEEMA